MYPRLLSLVAARRADTLRGAWSGSRSKTSRGTRLRRCCSTACAAQLGAFSLELSYLVRVKLGPFLHGQVKSRCLLSKALGDFVSSPLPLRQSKTMSLHELVDMILFPRGQDLQRHKVTTGWLAQASGRRIETESIRIKSAMLIIKCSLECVSRCQAFTRTTIAN